MKPARVAWRRVDGVLLLDKPAGMSSNDALQQARRLYRAAKGGHTGTLDPFATGLLPLCFGEATKFAGELLTADKHYLATVCLGMATDSGDATGRPLQQAPINVGRAEVEALLPDFRGEIEQVPPMHSALKRDGKPLYAYARAGIELERDSRRVFIHELELRHWQGEGFELEVVCSKGTYVRTLAADIGDRLGCGAHLSALRRLAIGSFSVAQALTPTDLQAMSEAERDACLLPVDALLADLPVARLGPADTRRMLHGQGIDWVAAPGQRYRLYGDDGQFIGLGAIDDDGLLSPRRLVATQADERRRPDTTR